MNDSTPESMWSDEQIIEHVMVKFKKGKYAKNIPAVLILLCCREGEHDTAEVRFGPPMTVRRYNSWELYE